MSNVVPRIAFCFSWQARTLNQTYLFFQKNLFDAAKEQWFDYDIFCAVEDDEDVDKVKLLNPVKIEKIKSSEVEKKMQFDINNDKNLKYFDCDYARFLPWAVQQQWYKIEKSFIIKDDYKKEKNLKYDIVFRLRFDVYFTSKINYNSVLNIVQDEWKVICNRYWKYPNEIRSITDLYFICSDEDSTKLIDNMFSKFKFYSKNLISLRFLIVNIASKLILFLLKINYNIHLLSSKALLNLKMKYIFWVLVPEVLLYKAFLFSQLKVFKSTIKVWLLRKNWNLSTDWKWGTKFEI